MIDPDDTPDPDDETDEPPVETDTDTVPVDTETGALVETDTDDSDETDDTLAETDETGTFNPGETGDTGLGLDDCEVLLTINTVSFGSEVGWEVLDSSGNVVAGQAPGAYVNNSTYNVVLDLPSDDYTFVLIDSYGDGWNGGSYTLIGGGGVISGGTLPTGTQGQNRFGWDCDNETGDIDTAILIDTYPAGACSLNVFVETSSFGSDVGWTLTDQDLLTTAAVGTGQYGSNETHSTWVEAATGTYELTGFDAFGDGWDGGEIIVSDSNGTILAQGTVEDDEEAWSFDFDCDFDTAEDTDTAGDSAGDTEMPEPEPDCTHEIIFDAVSWAGEISWQLYGPDGSLVAEALQGDYANNTTYTIEVDLGMPGTYTLEQSDSYGDGWNGGTFTLVDSSGAIVGTAGLAGGSSGSAEFNVECGDAAVVPEVPESCDLAVDLSTVIFADEMGWNLYAPNGTLVGSGSPGDYMDFTDYQASFSGLNQGEYTLELTDVYGDGWNGGTYSVSNANGDVLAAGTMTNADGDLLQVGFDHVCGVSGGGLDCEGNFELSTVSWGGEVSWAILDPASGDVLYEGDGYANNGFYEVPVDLEAGSYVVEMYDSYGDGWNGGSFELIGPDGGVTASGGLTSGSFGSVPFDWECEFGAGDSADSGLFGGGGDDTALGGDGECSFLLTVNTVSWASEIGWDLIAPDGTIVDSVSSGTYVNNTVYEVPFDGAPGTWTYEQTDSYGDGWNGGTFTITDSSGNVLASGGMTTGSFATDDFDIECGDSGIFGDTANNGGGGDDSSTFGDTANDGTDTDDGPIFTDSGDTSLAGVDTDASSDSDDTDSLVLVTDTAYDCFVDITFTSGLFPTEVGWSLLDDAGNTVFDVPFSSYTTTYTTFPTNTLPVDIGTYTLVMSDSYGDGWNGGEIEVVEAGGGDTLGEGELTTGQSTGSFDFVVDCITDTAPDPVPDCTLELEVDASNWGNEMGFEVTDATGAVLASAVAGDLATGTVYTYTLDPVVAGDVDMSMTDSYGDGWNGSSYTFTDSNGNEVASGTLSTGFAGVDTFLFDCLADSGGTTVDTAGGVDTGTGVDTGADTDAPVPVP